MTAVFVGCNKEERKETAEECALTHSVTLPQLEERQQSPRPPPPPVHVFCKYVKAAWSMPFGRRFSQNENDHRNKCHFVMS